MSNTNIQDITINCQDGHQLAATKYSPASSLKSAIMISPATGIKRQFYHNFAHFLADKGYGVVTFDNRGIGGSLHGPINRSKTLLQCWGQLDMPAVLNTLKSLFPNTSYHLVGHSAGGQLVGLMSNAQDLTSIFNYACSSGQLKNLRFSHFYKAHFYMNFFIPISNLLFGHVKSHWVGMGEPLPKQVAKQWRTWCNGDGYAKTAFGKSITQHWYDEITMPVMWANAIDDGITSPKNIDGMLNLFTNIQVQRLILIPKEHHLTEIGHMKFFSRKASHLWQFVLDWLRKHDI